MVCDPTKNRLKCKSFYVLKYAASMFTLPSALEALTYSLIIPSEDAVKALEHGT